MNPGLWLHWHPPPIVAVVAPVPDRVAFTWVRATHATGLFFGPLPAFR